MSDYAAAIAAAASASPMTNNAVPVERRVLLVDGDGLAYYCAGNDETSIGEARARLIDKVKGAQRASGAEDVRILLTNSGSHKGHRYAIARVKPYQGQRVNSRRPKNWRGLRELMETGSVPFTVEGTSVAEADDLFGYYAYRSPDDVVIYTQDKDMRMLPGRHLDWVSNRMHYVSWISNLDGTLTVNSSVFNDKWYGPMWFWLQMLHGDTADYIPGLPKYLDEAGKLKPCGEVTAGRLVAGQDDADLLVAGLYKGFYGDRWLTEMLEQAALLWMRRVPDKWDDCLAPGGPLAIFNDGTHGLATAWAEINERVQNADTINTLSAEGQ